MEKENDIVFASIYSLPDETITTILQYCNIKDILNFSITCKRFYNIINSNQCLWKSKFKYTLPADGFTNVEEHTNGDWLKEIKDFFVLKNQLYYELSSMSPKYWQKNGLNFGDIKHFFFIALSDKLNFYYTIYILQNLIKRGNNVYDKCYGKKPFTLTEMHYAKIVLSYLIHTFLAMKWGIAFIKQELKPETVITFFIQWIDIFNLYTDEDVENKIIELTKRVAVILNNSKPTNSVICDIQEKVFKGVITEKQVLSVITHVIYKENNIVVIPTGNLDALNIIKVINRRCGNMIVAAIVYQAIAEKLGVKCDLIAFFNHFILRWQSGREQLNTENYSYIKPSTGELYERRQCPFAQQNQNTNLKYCPFSLLIYIYNTYKNNVGSNKDWYMQSASLLANFLNTDVQSPYKNITSFISQSATATVIETSLKLNYLSDVHRHFMWFLSNTNLPSNTTINKSNENIIVKKRNRNVKFAVGMICYHKDYDYVCIIRDWFQQCPETEKHLKSTLYFGLKQPFYRIVAADQSERLVAQENLIEMTHPTRLYHLEDIIAREFSHFDGFAYVLNDEKKAEYPEETFIVDVFRCRAQLKP